MTPRQIEKLVEEIQQARARVESAAIVRKHAEDAYERALAELRDLQATLERISKQI